jgi:hypothetical protein
LDVVAGYLENIDTIPREARNAGLEERVAFILPRKENGQPEMAPYFLLVEVLEELLQVELPELDAALAEPTDALRFSRDGKLIAMLVSEPYALFGGPPPYHDHYVATLFSAEDLLPKIAEKVSIGDVQKGAPRKHWDWKGYLSRFLKWD